LGCFLVVRPFVSAALWSIVMCVSTWGLFQRLLAHIGHRKTLGALIMTLVLLLAIVGPFAIVGWSLVGDARVIAGEVKNVLQREPPKLPDWVARLPVVGTQLSDAYRQIIGNEVERAEQVKKLTGPFGRLIVSWSRAFAAGLWQFLLSLLIGFF